MKNKEKKAYTLIELVIVLAIIAIISMMTYLPYSFYQNKENLRIGAKEIAQNINEARNLAINGLSNSNSNVSIGIYFNSSDKNKFYFISYPFDYIGPLKVEEDLANNIKLLRTREIPKNITINSISGKDNLLIIYDAITGNAKYFYKQYGAFIRLPETKIIDFNIGFKGTQHGILSKNIHYDTKTFIVDY